MVLKTSPTAMGVVVLPDHPECFLKEASGFDRR